MRLARNLCLIVLSLLAERVLCDYWEDRAQILATEKSKALGSDIKLSQKEQLVNEKLMQLKLAEWEAGFKDQSAFAPAMHFFRARSQIDQSEVYKFLKKVPKGALLHSHNSAMVSFDYLFNLTYRDNVYGCVGDDGVYLLSFMESKTQDNSCDWKLLSDARKEDLNFDDYLKSQLTTFVEDPESEYLSIDEIWAKFQKIFSTIGLLLTYKPVFRDYFTQTMKEFYEEKIIYMEMRSGLGATYDLNGTWYTSEDTIEQYQELIADFKKSNPDFYDARVIYAKNRRQSNSTVQNYLDTFLSLQNQYPKFVLGFDLVSQEDLGEPLVSFADLLLAYKDVVRYFFHAGETNWNGASSDINVIDAILLDSVRIGHGYSIIRHPEALRLVKEKDIGIELNPLSNQILELVHDLRDHTGAYLIANGYPVVITCDDPGLWGAKGVTYDWYMTFMGLASKDGDLRLLKQLANNSIIYSGLDANEKEALSSIWHQQWDQFIDDVIAEYYRY